MGEFAIDNRDVILVVMGIESKDVVENHHGELEGEYGGVGGDPFK